MAPSSTNLEEQSYYAASLRPSTNLEEQLLTAASLRSFTNLEEQSSSATSLRRFMNLEEQSSSASSLRLFVLFRQEIQSYLKKSSLVSSSLPTRLEELLSFLEELLFILAASSSMDDQLIALEPPPFESENLTLHTLTHTSLDSAGHLSAFAAGLTATPRLENFTSQAAFNFFSDIVWIRKLQSPLSVIGRPCLHKLSVSFGLPYYLFETSSSLQRHYFQRSHSTPFKIEQRMIAESESTFSFHKLPTVCYSTWGLWRLQHFWVPIHSFSMFWKESLSSHLTNNYLSPLKLNFWFIGNLRALIRYVATRLHNQISSVYETAISSAKGQ